MKLKSRLIVAVCLYAMASVPAASQELSSSNASRCVGLLNSFQPYAVDQTPTKAMRDEARWSTDYRRLLAPVDIDGDGTLEDVHIMTGNAVRSFRPAWDYIVFIQPGDKNTSDGTPGSERLVKDFNRRGHVVGFVRQQIFASGVGQFKLSGPAAHVMPQIEHALVEIGAMGDLTYLKLRIEPRSERDPETGALTDPYLRYEALAQLKGINQLEVHCVWKLTDLAATPSAKPQ